MSVVHRHVRKTSYVVSRSGTLRALETTQKRTRLGLRFETWKTADVCQLSHVLQLKCGGTYKNGDEIPIGHG